MILDSGLDFACTIDARMGTSITTSSDTTFTPWITYAAFGTSSTAPTAGDTSLGAQVGARSNNPGGFASAARGGLDSVNKRMWYEAEFTRTFTIGSNVNATEWGLAPALTGNLSVRELFRTDPTNNSSNPITLTLESGDELQLVITLRIEAAWELETKSFTITGTAGNDTNGTHKGYSAITTGTQTTLVYIRGALAAAWPGGVHNTGINRYGYLWQLTADASGVSVAENATGSTEVAAFDAPTSYTPGSFRRDYSVTLGTSTANGDHYGWTVGHTSGANGTANIGYRFALVDPAKLVKAATHKLALTVRKSISRL